MLAPTLDGNPPRIAPIARVGGCSASLLLAAFGVAGVFFFHGGFETLVGACAGALIGSRNSNWRNAGLARAISGAFAGLFAGALFAGFFHDVLTAAF